MSAECHPPRLPASSHLLHTGRLRILIPRPPPRPRDGLYRPGTPGLVHAGAVGYMNWPRPGPPKSWAETNGCMGDPPQGTTLSIRCFAPPMNLETFENSFTIIARSTYYPSSEELSSLSRSHTAAVSSCPPPRVYCARDRCQGRLQKRRSSESEGSSVESRTSSVTMWRISNMRAAFCDSCVRENCSTKTSLEACQKFDRA